MTTPVRILYLIRGVPGSGKTTYAKTLGIPDHYEADKWFDANGGYDPEKIKQAHEWCQEKARQAMEAGRPCVVSNTFTRLWEMEYYRAVAKRLGYEVREVVMRGEWQNVHGVPHDKVRQMRERFEYANSPMCGNNSGDVPGRDDVGTSHLSVYSGSEVR